MKVLLFYSIVMISINQIQGFYVPPQDLCVYANDCHQEIIDNVVEAMEEYIDEESPPMAFPIQQELNYEAQPMLDYPPMQPFLVKELVDKIWKLRQAVDVRRRSPSPIHSISPVRIVRL